MVLRRAPLLCIMTVMEYGTGWSITWWANNQLSSPYQHADKKRGQTKDLRQVNCIKGCLKMHGTMPQPKKQKKNLQEASIPYSSGKEEQAQHGEWRILFSVPMNKWLLGESVIPASKGTLWSLLTLPPPTSSLLAVIILLLLLVRITTNLFSSFWPSEEWFLHGVPSPAATTAPVFLVICPFARSAFCRVNRKSFKCYSVVSERFLHQLPLLVLSNLPILFNFPCFLFFSFIPCFNTHYLSLEPVTCYSRRSIHAIPMSP